MKISQMIKQLNNIKNQYGDLEIFNENEQNIETVSMEDCENGDYPPDGNMPLKFVRIY